MLLSNNDLVAKDRKNPCIDCSKSLHRLSSHKALIELKKHVDFLFTLFALTTSYSSRYRDAAKATLDHGLQVLQFLQQNHCSSRYHLEYSM